MRSDMRNANNEYNIEKLGTALRPLRYSHPTTGPQRLAQQYSLTDRQSKSAVENIDEPSIGVLIKRCSKNIQQTYRRTPI